MRERRALRFVVEALFLGALAAAVVVADLQAAAIVGVMLLGWLVVALYEWAATRDRPHYGRGLPPRYYVPQVSLPPPRPLEQLSNGYPSSEALDEEPTWIASPAMRDELLPEWPVVAGVLPAPGEETMVDGPLDAELAEGYPNDTLLDVRTADGRQAEPVAAALTEPELVEEAERVEQPAATAVAVAALEQPSATELAPREPAVPRAAEAVAAASVAEELEPDLATEPEAADREKEPVSTPATEQRARHRFDPLGGGTEPRRRWRRPAVEDDGVAHVADRPPVPAGLPGFSRREH